MWDKVGWVVPAHRWDLGPDLCHTHIVSVILGSFDCLFVLSLGQHRTKAQSHSTPGARDPASEGPDGRPRGAGGWLPEFLPFLPSVHGFTVMYLLQPSGKDMHARATCESPWGRTGSGGQQHDTWPRVARHLSSPQSLCVTLSPAVFHLPTEESAFSVPASDLLSALTVLLLTPPSLG